MKARTRVVILVGLVGLLVSIAAGCRTSASRPGEFELTKGTSKAQLLSTNGIWTNGISTNGIWTNGIWTNGIWTNGIWTNGIWTNGIWTNGVSTNGIWTNGIWTNGIGTNGIWTNGIWTNGIWTNGSVTTNGIWTNGIWTNGIWTNGIWTNGLAGEDLKSNRYTRQLLQYIYACAMPGTPAPAGGGGLYDTTLDPGAGPCGDGGTCGDFYECSPNNTCVIPLKGAIGLGINADGTHWWDPPPPSDAGDAATSEAGECDETCQRWVSACLLARTNAYGVHVKISMRAPANAPQAIRDALAVSDVERNGDDAGDAPYSLREGAYYGNLFATTPGSLGATGNFVPATDGKTANVIEETPAFFACAGPGSNIPEITKRFCSSQGDQVVIGVPGVCLSNPTTGEVGTCAAEDTDPNSATFGAIQHCYTSTSATSTNPCSGPSDPACYDQVITVYLQQPIAVCGNAVCEAGESDASSPNYCPSDCHPGTWATDFAPAQQPAASLGRDVSIPYNSGVEPVRTFALMPPPDNSIVAAGMNYGDVTFGGPAGGTDGGPGGFASGTFPASQGIGVLAKYNADGSGGGGIRFGPQPQATGSSGANRDWEIMAIAVSTANGDITVVGWEFLSGFYAIWGTTFNSSGVQVGSTWTVPTGTGARLLVPEAVAVDSGGNIIFAGEYAGNVTFGSYSFSSGNSGIPGNPPWDTFVAKVSPQGTVMWAKGLGEDSSQPVAARSVVVDASNNVVLLTGNGALANSPTLNSGSDFEGLLQRMCPDGSFGQCPDGTTPTSTGQGSDLVLGTCSDGSAAKCPDHSTPWTKSLGFGDCSTSHFFSAAVDNTGSVYASGFVDRNQNFGNGPITAPATSNDPPVIVKYGSDGTFEWASWANIVCGGTASCSGNACGGTSIAGVNISFDQVGNAIVASFGDSAVGGGVDFGVGTFPTYSSSNIFLSAYEPIGGKLVWAKQIPMILSSSIGAMALDGNGRVVVNGGYAGSMQFDDRLLVTSVPEDPKTVDSFLASFGALSPNTAAPVIGSAVDQDGTSINTVTSHIYAEATSSAGAKVFFMLPTAVDNGNAADGGPGGNPPGTSVVCSPLPNTTFPIRTTTVTCTASDPFGHSSSASFQVTVVDTLPPIFSFYTDTTVVQTSANGATVPYPTATDQVDGAITPVCTPPAGTALPIGQTTVRCTATDAHSNQSQATFVVTVTPGTFCTTCAAQGATCGSIPDGCGNTLNCGSCTLPQTCGGGGTPNVCGGCQPITTCPAGDNCGTVPDGCGGSLSCGSCSGFLTCGGGGTANVCGGCQPMTACPSGDNCGTVPDGCGGTLSCGSCSGFLTCGGNGTANVCGCKPMTACPAGDNCGTVPDGCGGTLSCGSCSGFLTCGGNGTANVCGGCTPTTCAAQNAACGSIPDGCGHTLNCGSCPGPKLTLPGTITATATSASGAVVTYSASATDPADGSIKPVCKPASGSTFALGTTTVSCTATNSHGVQATGSFQVQVQYAWSGILRPIHADGSSIFDLGSTVRVRFGLSGASAGITNAGATLTVTKLSSTVAGTHLQYPSSATPTTGSTFKYNPVTQHYFFNLATNKLSAGAYSLAIDLHDGVSRTAQISLKAFTCGNCESDDGGD